MITRHAMVRASAGTGKTYRLAVEYVRLLIANASPDEILATTFTRKAAGEIFERVLMFLAEASSNPKYAVELEKDCGKPDEGGWPALLQRFASRIDRVRISTLDSFFHSAASAFRWETGLAPAASMIALDDPAASSLRKAAIGQTLSRVGADKMCDLLTDLADGKPARSVETGLDQILKNLRLVFRESAAEAWERPQISSNSNYDHSAHPEPVEGWAKLQCAHGSTSSPRAGLSHNWNCWQISDKRATEETLKSITSELRNRAETETKLNDKYAETADRVENRQWLEICSSGLFKNLPDYFAGRTAEPKFSKSILDDHVVELGRVIIAHACAELGDRIRARSIATRRLLEDLDGALNRCQAAENALFYDDIPALLSRFASDNDRFIERLFLRTGGGIRHLLLDEFQDTSPMQWRILGPLVAKIAGRGSGGAGEETASGRIVCVGDVKQAIYGWRGGSSRVFDHVQRDLNIADENVERMYESRRSAQVVLDAVNVIFESFAHNPALEDVRDYSAVTRWQKEYSAHKAHDLKAEGYVEVRTSRLAKSDDDEKTNEARCSFAAELIQRVASERPLNSIGVLVATRGIGQLILGFLRDRGVDASSESGTTLTDDPAVNVILSALALADTPANTLAEFHLRTSPLAEILNHKSDSAAARIALSEKIRRALLERGYGAVIGEWAQHLAGAGDPEGKTAARLERLVEIAETFAPHDPLRPAEFIREVMFASVEAPGTSRVRVMTIHASKGLEFDIVILPELWKRMGDLKNNLVLARRDPETDLPTSVMRKPNKPSIELIPEVLQAYQAEENRRLEDDLCQLYVAMTRARHALYLIIPPLKESVSDGELTGKPTAAGRKDRSWASLIRNAVQPLNSAEAFSGDEIIFKAGSSKWKKKTIEAPESKSEELELPTIKLERKLRTRLFPRVTPSKLVRADSKSALRVYAGDSSDARERGILMHAFFELIEWLEADDDSGIPTANALSAAAHQAIPSVDEALVTQVARDFHEAINRPHVRAVFARPATDPAITLNVWRERAFAVIDDGRIVEGRFDRVVLHHRDDAIEKADIIDFKTDRIASEAEQKEREEHYAPQMEGYRMALIKLLSPENCKVKVVWVAPNSRRARPL